MFIIYSLRIGKDIFNYCHYNPIKDEMDTYK